MIKIVHKIVKYIMSFLLVMIILNILMYLSCTISSKNLKNNVIESAKILTKEGYFYPVKDISEVTNNNYTDAQIINELYSIDNIHPFISYMKTRKNYDKSIKQHEIEDVNGNGITVNYLKKEKFEYFNKVFDTISELNNYLDNNIHYNFNNGRYWHGYIMVYRPLLLIFNIKQIRLLLFIIYIILFITLIYLIYKRFDISKAIIFASSLICANYFSASYSLESTPIFLIMMISSILLLLKIDKIKDIGLYIFIVGCITNFFDYLTVPLITIGIILSLYVLKLFEEKKDWKYCIKFIIINSLIWLIGYTCTWFFKWILYDLTIPSKTNMIKVGITQCIFRIQRTSGNIYYGITVWDRIFGFLYNVPIYILSTLVLIIILKKFNYKINILNKKALVFLLISIMPITWYIALANHTIIHYHFVHRHIFVFILGILLASDEVLFSDNLRENKNEKKQKFNNIHNNRNPIK